jgi:Tfp pilus assembly protein PilX
MTRTSIGRSQAGASALIALVFLVIVAFVVLTAYRLSGQQLALVGNAQSRAQVLAAASFAIERTISTVDFLRTPSVVAATPVAVDIDGNGADDLNVAVGLPACYRLRVVPQAELDERRGSDRSCVGGLGAAGSILVIGGGAGGAANAAESQCADSEWNISATAADAVTSATLTVNQGVAVRADRVDATNNCT